MLENAQGAQSAQSEESDVPVEQETTTTGLETNDDAVPEPLALPNYEANTGHGATLGHDSVSQNDVTPPGHGRWQHRPPVGPLELLALPNSVADLVLLPSSTLGPDTVDSSTPSSRQSSDVPDTAATETPEPESPSRGPRQASPGASSPHSPKGVRFSNLIESTTFDETDPPSPNRSPTIVTTLPVFADDQVFSPLHEEPLDEGVLVDKEHLQLCQEEAFFLTFGLGALSVIDPATQEPISNETLFTLFGQYSHFPPLTTPIQPHTNFMVQYAAYHHYRSLGWVPRVGIKFGVDWLLYYRGPVFDHAEFGVIVLPSFTDPWWKSHDAVPSRAPRTWAWLHGVLRVLSRVMKTFVITYVEIPPPPAFDAALADGGAAAAMALYRVREVTVRRWSANRNRKGTTGRRPTIKQP
jgi:tRNA-splicing endonuclease subunit Sen2